MAANGREPPRCELGAGQCRARGVPPCAGTSPRVAGSFWEEEHGSAYGPDSHIPGRTASAWVDPQPQPCMPMRSANCANPASANPRSPTASTSVALRCAVALRPNSRRNRHRIFGFGANAIKIANGDKQGYIGSQPKNENGNSALGNPIRSFQVHI